MQLKGLCGNKNAESRTENYKRSVQIKKSGGNNRQGE